MKKLVVLTGAGISAESGLKTFRDSDGLWENYRIEDVATYDAWKQNPALVQQFYNLRRQQAEAAMPNAAHLGLAALEADFEVFVITQNVDNLHEKAGSSNVLHLHGMLNSAKCDHEHSYKKTVSGNLNMGDTCPEGHQLRPDIVWFGEDVPMMEPAAILAYDADVFAVIGTSLQVYSAASLLRFVRDEVPIFLIDPNPVQVHGRNVTMIQAPATKGVEELRKQLLK